MNDFNAFKIDLINLCAAQDEKTIIQALNALAPHYTITKISKSDEKTNTEILEQFLNAKSIEEKSPSTIKLYRTMLNQFFKLSRVNYNRADTNDIRNFLQTYKSTHNVQNSTLETMRRIINSFYEWCFNEGLVAQNPVRNITSIKCETKPRKAMRMIDLEYIREACKDAREKALVDFLFSTGCRLSEVCNVKLDDIDWKRNTILIRNGKGNKTRYTYINAECEVSLRAYLDSRTDTSPYIFAPKRKTKRPNLSSKGLSAILNNITARVEDKLGTKITPHIFRHTAATIALRNGMPIEQVQKFLGHSNINTTMIYAEVDNDDVRISHNKYLS